MNFDNICKFLAEEYPKEFVRWLLTTESTEVKILKTELSLEPIRADSVTFLQTANRILHIEFQTLTISNPPLPFRILDYSVRLKRQYRCPITQVVIFLQETSNEIAFLSEYVDETTIHRYRVVRLWEQDSGLFLDIPALLPLAPLTRTDSPQELLAQVAQRVATIPNRDERQNIAGCTEILAGLRFEKNLIRQFLREDIMQESVIYQDIVQKEALKWVKSFLNRRFSNIDSSIIERIDRLSTKQLEALREVLFDFSQVTDVVTWLDQQEESQNS